MTKDDIINKLQAQGLRWIESERDARSEPALDAVQRVKHDHPEPVLDMVKDSMMILDTVRH